MKKQFDKSKVKKMMRYSVKSVWILSRVKLVILTLLCAFIYFLGKTLVEFLTADNYPPAILISFLLGMAFTSSVNSLVAIGRIFCDRIVWVFENRNLLYKAS